MQICSLQHSIYNWVHNDIDFFFDNMDPPKPEIDVKWVLRHNYRTRFSFFEPLRPIFALKLSKVLIEAKKPDWKSASNSAFPDTHIAFLLNFCFTILALFTKFEGKRGQNGRKREKLLL